MALDPVSPDASALLVLDDDPAMGDLVVALAEELGYKASSVTHFAAFQAMYDASVDIVVLDLLMPDVDGVEVIRHLAANGCRSAVVLISAFDPRVLRTATQIAMGHGLRVVGSLTKPFGVDEFAAALRRARATRWGTRSREGRYTVSPEDLRHALRSNEVVPYFQPKVALGDSQIIGFEVLMRWNHPQRGLLLPEVFIELAESDLPLLEAMTERTVGQALRQVANWAQHGLNTMLAVNVSMRSLNHLDFPERLTAMIDAQGLSHSRMVIEVTESWLAEDLLTTLDILSRLRLKGFELSIDDYGTGYSTMEQLKQIPFSELKLDQSFVRGAADDSFSRIIVESTINMAHQLGLKVVAEGVETQEDWDFLVSVGCDAAQGYFISPAMPGAEVTAWAERWATMAH